MPRRGTKRQRPDTCEYGDRHYWEQRYMNEPESCFEWFAGFEHLEPLLRLYLPLDKQYDRDGDCLVDLGCGNSDLLVSLAGAGYPGPLVGVDYAAQVVEQQVARVRERWGSERIKFIQSDARDLKDLADESVRFVVDKSTMDTILHAPDGEHRVARMLNEVARILPSDGLYLLLTQLDPSSEQDAQFLTDTLLPGLGCRHFHYTVTAHSSTLVDVGKNGDACRLHLMAFRKRKRHRMQTRGGHKGGSVVIKIMDHGSI